MARAYKLLMLPTTATSRQYRAARTHLPCMESCGGCAGPSTPARPPLSHHPCTGERTWSHILVPSFDMGTQFWWGSGRDFTIPSLFCLLALGLFSSLGTSCIFTSSEERGCKNAAGPETTSFPAKVLSFHVAIPFYYHCSLFRVVFFPSPNQCKLVGHRWSQHEMQCLSSTAVVGGKTAPDCQAALQRRGVSVWV